jgi:hypothetical protein
MLDLHSAAALEGGLILVGGKAERVPEAHRVLHTSLSGRIEAGVGAAATAEKAAGNLELPRGAQRRGSVEGPVTPGGASQTVLEEHAHDGGHGQSAIGNLRAELPGLLLWVSRSQHLEAIVAGSAALIVFEASRKFDKAKVSHDLDPA